MQGLIELLGQHVDNLARMDRLLIEQFGLPQEWPEEMYAVGTPVWAEIPGKPELGTRPGEVVYVGAAPGHDAHDRRTIGIDVPGFVQIGGGSTFYSPLHKFEFWPRSVDEPD